MEQCRNSLSIVAYTNTLSFLYKHVILALDSCDHINCGGFACPCMSAMNLISTVKPVTIVSFLTPHHSTSHFIAHPHPSQSNPHTPSLTPHPSHPIPHTSSLTLYPSHLIPHIPSLTFHPSHSIPHISSLTLHHSHSIPCTPSLTLHHSHTIPHTPSLTLHPPHIIPHIYLRCGATDSYQGYYSPELVI